jgi:hypothetical protein
MADDAPIDGSAGDSIRRFEVVNGVEVIVHGDEPRARLAWRVIENQEAISAQAVRLLKSFMRDSGTFDLSGIEVFAFVTPEEGDFALRYTFTADRDPHEYNYTYFEVFFICHEPPQAPFWPFKFTVGFH